MSPRRLIAALLYCAFSGGALASEPTSTPLRTAYPSSRSDTPTATGESLPPTGVATAPRGESPAAAPQRGNQALPERPRKSRVLFITAKDCPRCEQELARLRRPGGDFDKMIARGWKIGAGPGNHLQIIDHLALGDLADQLQGQEFPTVACVDGQEIVRSFKSGCRTPLDLWTFGFLAKGIDERPPGAVLEAARVESSGHYPMRGNHWSIDEDWNPTRDRVISHLRSAHAHRIAANWNIETWSYEELRSLHDNIHESEMGSTMYATRSDPASQFSATRKAGGH